MEECRKTSLFSEKRQCNGHCRHARAGGRDGLLSCDLHCADLLPDAQRLPLLQGGSLHHREEERLEVYLDPRELNRVERAIHFLRLWKLLWSRPVRSPLQPLYTLFKATPYHYFLPCFRCLYNIRDNIKVIYYDDPIFQRLSDQTRCCHQCRTCVCGGRGEMLQIDAPCCYNMCHYTGVPCLLAPSCLSSTMLPCCTYKHEIYLENAQKGMYEINKVIAVVATSKL